MKSNLKSTFYLLFAIMILVSSCRKEEIQSVQAPQDETLNGNSSVALLMKRTASNDGSNDNIIDLANCFNIQFPFSVIANGISVSINSEADYLAVESIFDDEDNDTDYLEINYPINIVLSDFTQITINNYTELLSYANTCHGENEYDDDIECIDFQYPISASVFNTNNEIISTETFSNDYQLFEFIDAIDEDDIITINFPISVLLSDGSQMTIDSLSELETVIQNAEDDCDEDDDYDYNDDDCNNCTTNQALEVLTNCSDWIVDKLERNDIDYDDFYDGYTFNFFSDGTVSAYWNSTTVYGDWSSEGSGNSIIITIDIPGFPLCNNNWMLHEIESYSGETKVDLRVNDSDRLRYESTCN